MLKISALIYFFYTIPEGFLAVYSVYVFSNQKIKLNKFLITGVLFGIITYLVRLLPMAFGAHTMIILLIFIFMTIKINKISFIGAIMSCISYTIIQFLTEEIILSILIELTGTKNLLSDPVKTIEFGFPCLIAIFIIIKLIGILAIPKIYKEKSAV